MVAIPGFVFQSGTVSRGEALRGLEAFGKMNKIRALKHGRFGIAPALLLRDSRNTAVKEFAMKIRRRAKSRHKRSTAAKRGEVRSRKENFHGGRGDR